VLKDKITKAVKEGKIKWKRHALERMMERGIFRDDVRQVLLSGELIEEYMDDYPLPSGLFLKFINEKPIHVVAAVDKETENCYIITAYYPDLEHFESDYKTRKKDENGTTY
jgi:hypothetical protein